MNVVDFCARQVDTVLPDESVLVAAERMHQRGVGALVVVNRDLQVIGMVTDRDLAIRVLAKGLDAGETSVLEVMTAEPACVGEICDLERAVAIMRKGKFRRVPVVDPSNCLVGLITLDDLLIHLSEEFKQVGELIRSETPRAAADEQEFAGPWRLQNDVRISVGD